MAEASKVFPPLFIWLIASNGENLAEGFKQAAEIYYARATHKVDMLLYAALPVSILLIVVSLMLSFMLANSKSLRHLKEEMRLIEQHQLQQLKQSISIPALKPAGATNSVSGHSVESVPQPRQP